METPKIKIEEGGLVNISSLVPVSGATSQDITFYTGSAEVLKLAGNGDIFVHGRLAANDKEVVNGLRDFLFGVTNR